MSSIETGSERMGGVRRPEMSRPGFTSAGPAEIDQHRQNVGDWERLVGGLVGVGLVYLGLKRMSVGGLLVAGVGGVLVYRSSTGHCPGYQALGVDTAQKTGARPEEYFERGVHVEQSYMIDKPAAELYRFWRNFANLPSFMEHLQSVEVFSDTRSRWTACGPMGTHVSWEAEIIHDQPNELIAWKSVENSTIANAGTVRFTERGGQTEVKVVLEYIPPAGQVGKVIAQLFGEEPSQTIKEDLRRFKMKMEAGEIASTAGQPQGHCG